MPVVTSSPIIDELRSENERLTGQLDKRTATLAERDQAVARLTEQVEELRSAAERSAADASRRASTQRRIATVAALVSGICVCIISAAATANVAVKLGLVSPGLSWAIPLALEGSAIAAVAMWSSHVRRARHAAVLSLAMVVCANVAHLVDEPPRALGWVLAAGVPVLLALIVESLMGGEG